MGFGVRQTWDLIPTRPHTSSETLRDSFNTMNLFTPVYKGISNGRPFSSAKVPALSLLSSVRLLSFFALSSSPQLPLCYCCSPTVPGSLSNICISWSSSWQTVSPFASQYKSGGLLLLESVLNLVPAECGWQSGAVSRWRLAWHTTVKESRTLCLPFPDLLPWIFSLTLQRLVLRPFWKLPGSPTQLAEWYIIAWIILEFLSQSTSVYFYPRELCIP